MTLDIIVKLFEFLIVSPILIKYVRFLFKNRTLQNIEIFVFVFFVWLNIIFFNLKYESIYLSNFIDAALPVFIFIFIALEKSFSVTQKTLISITISGLNLYFFNFYTVIFISLASICVLILKSVKLTKLKSNKLQLSSLFLVISIDQIFSLQAYILTSIKFDWHFSDYLVYFRFSSYFVYCFTYVFIYVKFRRLNSI